MNMENVKFADGRKLLEHFRKAAVKLKYPKIKVNIGQDNKLVMYLAGVRSKNLGGIEINNGYSFGDPDSIFYGRVLPNGAVQFTYRAVSNPAIADTINAIIADPIGTAKVIGQRTGHCIFCSRELTDAKSIFHGYGPVCAENFGLPWGDKPNSTDANIANKLEEI